MGIFGALTTAVSGMQAQSFALQNISGNIANSQTTAYKRIDSSFEDMIQDRQPSKQNAGSVMAMSRATNTVQGDIQSSSISTHMAINGDGYFVVMKSSGQTDNTPTFSGVNNYTRRGDFQPNKSGYLVNGSGYYLMGIPIDSKTGNPVGSVPQVLKFQNDFLPAQATAEINYRLNLPRVPHTNSYSSKIPGSELLNPGAFTANPIAGPNQPAKIIGYGATLKADAPAKVTGAAVMPAALVNPTSGASTLTINSSAITLTAGMTPAQVANAISTSNAGGMPAGMQSVTIDASGHLVMTSTNAETPITIASNATALLTELGLTNYVGTNNPTNLLTQSAVSSGQALGVTIGGSSSTLTFGTGAGQISTMAELATALSTGITGGSGSVDSQGNITITAANSADTIVINTPDTVAAAFGIHVLQGLPSNGTVVGQDQTAFLNQTIGAGAVTAFDSSGSPVDIQLRWAKVASSDTSAADTWNLFYQTDSRAGATDAAWKNIGVNYTFGADFQLNPPIDKTAMNNVVIDGVTLGNLTMNFGSSGITQFADTNGTAQVNLLQQNGFAAGNLQSVAVNDQGRVVGSYSNGRSLDLAEITLAKFNGANNLKRVDGGAFEATDESGQAIYGSAGKIVGSSLEASNTDIADEFTKLIVTQQAYSANTRVITTSNQMVQDLLNMLR